MIQNIFCVDSIIYGNIKYWIPIIRRLPIQGSIHFLSQGPILLNFTYNFVKIKLLKSFIFVKNIFLFVKKCNLVKFFNLFLKRICDKTSMKYYIIIFIFRVRFKVWFLWRDRFKVADFCEGSVLRSPIFVKVRFRTQLSMRCTLPLER